MEQQNQDFSPIDFEAGAAQEPAPAGAESARRPKKRGGATWALAIVVVLAILALAGLCVSIFAPDFFNSVFNSTPLTRGDETVMTIGEFEISAMEYNHYLYPVRTQYGQDDENYWKTHLELGESYKEQALEMLRDNCAMLQWAADAGIELTEAEQGEAEQMLEQIKASYETEADYYAALEENCLTVELYKMLYEQSLLYDKLYTYVYEQSELKEVSEEELQAYAGQNGYLGAKHILFATTGDEETDREKLELAQQVLEQLQSGADFDTLMLQYTEDPGVLYNPDGYTFIEGEMVPEFEDAVKALEIGELSGIVQSTHGYHIILRIEPDKTTMTDAVIQQRAMEKIQEYRDAMEVQFARGYEKITLDQVTWDYPPVAEAQDAA